MNKLLLLIVITLLFSCSERKEAIGQAQPDGQTNIQFLSTVKLPEKLDFCGEAVPLNIDEVRERAEREFYVNLQQPGQIILYLKRAGRFFPIFEKILKDNDLPDDLKYIAVAESALYMSKSPKDALGIWQFIAETGKRMGLIVNEFVEERCNVEKSTRAAIKYLKQGFDLYKSWSMAAAGYNMGHPNLSDNVEFQDAKSFFDLYLNEETSRYMLRIVIIKEIMQNAEKYGFILKTEDLYKPERTNIIQCSSEVPNLAQWAKENGTTYKYVKLLNPWILKRKLPAPVKGMEWEIAIPTK
jgi:membrane-bound lytic murein transglycosylase D